MWTVHATCPRDTSENKPIRKRNHDMSLRQDPPCGRFKKPIPATCPFVWTAHEILPRDMSLQHVPSCEPTFRLKISPKHRYAWHARFPPQVATCCSRVLSGIWKLRCFQLGNSAFRISQWNTKSENGFQRNLFFSKKDFVGQWENRNPDVEIFYPDFEMASTQSLHFASSAQLITRPEYKHAKNRIK